MVNRPSITVPGYCIVLDNDDTATSIQECKTGRNYGTLRRKRLIRAYVLNITKGIALCRMATWNLYGHSTQAEQLGRIDSWSPPWPNAYLHNHDFDMTVLIFIRLRTFITCRVSFISIQYRRASGFDPSTLFHTCQMTMRQAASQKSRWRMVIDSMAHGQSSTSMINFPSPC